MTASTVTPTLSFVITAWGSISRTVSRISIRATSESTNGTRILNPGSNVSLYLPSLSTIPFSACRTILTDRASTITASNASTSKKAVNISILITSISYLYGQGNTFDFNHFYFTPFGNFFLRDCFPLFAADFYKAVSVSVNDFQYNASFPDYDIYICFFFP